MKYFIILIGLSLIGCAGGQDTQFTQLSELEPSPFKKALESRLEQETTETKIGRKKKLSTEKGQVGENAFKQEETITEAEAEVTVELTVGAESEKTTAPAVAETDKSEKSEKSEKKSSAATETSATTVTVSATAEASAEVSTKQDSSVKCKADKSGKTGKKQGRKWMKEKVDIHFYIDSRKTTSLIECSNEFAADAYDKGFLSHLPNLNWQFSYSVFSSGSNEPGYLEFDGAHVPEVHRARARRSTAQTVLTQRFAYYEDIFSYTIAPFYTGDHFYMGMSHDNKSTVYHDAPYQDAGKGKNPLVGLHDLLTKKYDGAIRSSSSRIEVFVIANKFPGYPSEDIAAFLNAHKKLRVHVLYKKSQKSLGSLVELVKRTGGSLNKLCGNENIGPKLAKVIQQNSVAPKKKKCKKR